MIDVAKVADLVLLLIDASFGFEMEIFEFLNICQVGPSFFISCGLFFILNFFSGSWFSTSYGRPHSFRLI